MDLYGARVLHKAGLLRAIRPNRLLGMGLSVAHWGMTPAAGYAAAAARDPHGVALIDDEGSLTFRELDERSNQVAVELRSRGVLPGSSVGLLARNGRGFVQTLIALSKCGADVLFLNTASAPEQLAQVLEREGAVAVCYDEDLAPLIAPGVVGRIAVTTEELSQRAARTSHPRPPKHGREPRLVILTSGTTGAPRGAARSSAGADDLVSVLSRIPLKARETTVIAAPLFHSWGLAHLTVTALLGTTAVLQRRFEPTAVLQSLQDTKATALIAVPVMLSKMLAAEPEGYDTSALRIIASSGSALPGELATRVLAAFGPVLYNLYGSTEVAYAAVANPEDLAEDPHTAGRPPHGVRVRVVDSEGRDCDVDVPGRVFVAGGMSFGGYTDGTDKERLDGLVSTGDLGMWDARGRLTVLGRDDDMVVIGGENIYTSQVEDVLQQHPGVVEAAVTSSPDPEFGVRLIAHVVGDVTAEELQTLVRDRLARFAVPREVRFLPTLPRNATGKVVKRELG